MAAMTCSAAAAHAQGGRGGFGRGLRRPAAARRTTGPRAAGRGKAGPAEDEEQQAIHRVRRKNLSETKNERETGQTAMDWDKQIYHGEEDDESYLLVGTEFSGTAWFGRKSSPESSPEN